MINLDSAYTPAIRSYHPSMRGIFGFSTPDSDKVGVVRQLTLNSGILNTRGFLNTDMNAIEPSTGMFSPAELMTPFTATHADPPRCGMMSTQQKHIIPITKSTKPMFGSGMERAMPYLMSSDFVFRAKQSGVIEMIDEESHIAILKYDDGAKDVIDISRQMAKNSNGGFYISNTKNLLKGVGERFKANEILAKNDDYFLGDKAESTVYSTGRMSKVTISSGDYTLILGL